jgi:hypothetical protein
LFFFEEEPLANRRNADITTAPAHAENDATLKVADRFRRDVAAQVGLLADIVGSQAFGFQLIADSLRAMAMSTRSSRASISTVAKASIRLLSIRMNPRGLCNATMFGKISLA